MLGRLSGTEAETVEQHLEQCPRCDALVDRLPAEDPLVQAMRAGSPLVEGPDGPAVERLIGRLRVLQAPPAGTSSSTSPAAPSVSPSLPAEGIPAALGPPQGPGEMGRFGPYVVLDVLGSGGMGTVFRARQARPQRLVALKIIPAGRRAGPERLARFRAEAEVLGRLAHPNIVPVYEVGEHQDQLYFTMEYVDGGSLAHRLAATPLAARAAAALVEALARAVHFAHGHGFIHRDLKPSNVLLTAGGVPKVGDFGLAKQFAEPEGDLPPEYRTESGAILGTPGYMAPEQATGQTAGVGPAADTYALGAILYEALTGRPPFKAASVLETLEQVRTQEPCRPAASSPACRTACKRSA
jgi:serine/threonine protein kinase